MIVNRDKAYRNYNARILEPILSFLLPTFFFLYFSRIDSPVTINFSRCTFSRSFVRLFVPRFPWTNFSRPRENCKGNNPHCVRVTNESIRVRCDSESLKKDYRSKPEGGKKKKGKGKEKKRVFLSPIDFYAVTITGGVWIMPFPPPSLSRHTR